MVLFESELDFKIEKKIEVIKTVNHDGREGRRSQAFIS